MSATRGGAIKLYLINAGSSVLTRFLQVTVLVWVNQHLLRRIEPEEYSIFPLVISLMYFAELLRYVVTGGLGRFIVEADSRDDDREVTRIVSSIFPVLIVVAIVLVAAGGVTAWNLGGLLNIKESYLPQARIMLMLLVLSLGLNVITAPFVEGAYVRQRFVALNLIDLGCEALRILILLALLLGVSTEVMWLIVASTCGGVVNILLRIRLTRQLLPAIRFEWEYFSLATARRLIRFGAWTSIQGMTGLVSSTAPALLLNRFASPVDVTSFYLGRLPEIQIRALASVASSPAQPALTRIYATQGKAALHELYYRGGRYHLWFTLLLVAPLLAFAPQIILLYAGEQYSAAPAVIFALLGAYPFLWASAMFFQVAHAMGKVGAYYICDTFVQLATLGAMYYAVAVLDLGAPGAAVAMGVTGGVMHLILIWPMGLRLVEGRWRDFFAETFVPGILPFAVALLAGYGVGRVLRMDSWLHIAVGTTVACLAYLLVLLVFGLDPLDRSLLLKMWNRMRAVWPRLEKRSV
jgi:O-antigen/teichoic acid export membrane protein